MRSTRIGCTKCSGVAQLAEQVAVNHRVVGSNPTAGAILKRKEIMGKRKVDVQSTLKTKRRYVGEALVTHVLYDGHNVGHGGSYMSGSVNGELVVDENGKPLPLKQIGILQ